MRTRLGPAPTLVLEDAVDDGEEATDFPLLCVAHVGDAEGLLLEVAVAVRDGGPLLAQLRVEAGDRDAARVRDAGQGRRLVSLLGEDGEVPPGPVPDDPGEAFVPRVSRGRRLGEDVVELRVE